MPDAEEALTKLIGAVADRVVRDIGVFSPDSARQAMQTIHSTPLIVSRAPAHTWNAICWRLALDTNPAEAMEACERAVALMPGEGDYRDSRRVMRARLGNYAGAIEDFEVFTRQTTNARAKAQRQRWIVTLRNGTNPLTAEEIKAALEASLGGWPARRRGSAITLDGRYAVGE